MPRHFAILFTLCSLMIGNTLRAQNIRASLSHYSTDDGLATNAIAQIIQDDYGYIWLATWNGLSRFDGYTFYNYRTGNASHIPNLHNRVLGMVVDHSQNIWLRMYDGRIFVLNRQKDRIINPFETVGDSDEYRTNIPLFMMNNGDVLASFDNVGLYKMRLDKSKADMQLITTGGLKVKCMAEGYHDDIWVGTEKGLHRIDIGNLTIERQGFFEDEEVTALFSNGFNVFAGCNSGSIYMYSYGQESLQLRKPNGNGILNIFVDSHGIIWFTDSRYGITRLNCQDNTEKHFQQVVPAPEYDSAGGSMNEVLGTVWLRMNHGGYGYYDRDADEVNYFHNDPSNPWNLSNTINAVAELPEGVIFMSTSRRGLEKLEIQRNTITRTKLVPNAETPIENEVRGMLYDQKHKLLIMGNKANTLFLIKQDGSRTTLTHDSDGNPIGRIYGLSMDREGNIWLCSKDYGVFKLTLNENGSHTMLRFCHNEDDKYSLSSNAAYQAIEDKNGNIWVATYGGGINVLHRDKNGKYKALHSKNDIRNYPRNSYMKVRTITKDKEGNIWAGTTDGILIMSLADDNKFYIQKLQNSEEKPDKILMSTDIVILAKDRIGDIWVGTNSGGLAHAIGKDSKGAWYFESFGTKDGLPSEEVKSITFDKNNNVWFAMDHIICTYNPTKKVFTTFSSLDGVDETLCSEGAAITLPNGNILIGTLNGYYTIDKKKLETDNASMLKLRITDFFLNNKLVSPQTDDTYDFFVPDSKQVTLPQHDAAFGFRFASLNYQLQHRIHYQYLLEGYDKSWQNADKKTRIAKYEDVPTGNYKFKVRAFLLESPDKYDIKEIQVKVPPYFLLSKEAIWLYMTIALALSLGIMFLRERHLRKIQEQKVLTFGAQEFAYTNEDDYYFVKSLQDWLEVNYSSPDLKIDELVQQSKMERSDYVSRLAKITGLVPKDFISDFRLKKAIMFLENTHDTVAEIAEKTGFTDPIYFTRTFKQKTGLTPSRYREQKNEEKKHENSEETDAYEIVEEIKT